MVTAKKTPAKKTSVKIKTDDKIIKLKSTIFPLGFTVGSVEGQVLIIDFVDTIDGKTTITESIALPTGKAAQLATAITDSIRNGKSED